MVKNSDNGGNGKFDYALYLRDYRDGRCSVDGNVPATSKMEKLLCHVTIRVSSAKARVYRISSLAAEFIQRYF